MKNLPEKIYLDLGFYVNDSSILPSILADDFNDLKEVTWSRDNATKNGIEYIRNDLAEKQIDDTIGQLLNPLTKLLNDSEFREYVTEFINSRKAEPEQP